HLDGGQTAGFVYLCVNGDCRTATKVGNRYERSFAPVTTATTYSIEFKIQDNAIGQCLTSASVKPGNAVASTPCYSGSVPVSSAATSSAPASIPASSIPASSAPAATSSSSANTDGAGVFGLTTSGLLYHLNGGQTGGFVYLCLNDNCQTATKTNGRYERNFGSVGAATNYKVEFKIQDNATGQCITSGNLIPGSALSETACFNGSVSVSSASVSSLAPGSSSKSSTPLNSSSKSSTPLSSSSKSSTPLSSSSQSSAVALPSSSSQSSSSSAPAASGDFGLVYVSNTSGIIRHRDKPFTAAFANLCFNGACSTATLRNGYWERNIDGLTLGAVYNIGTQIQDNAIGQCAINTNVTFQKEGTFVTSACLPPDLDAPTLPSNLQGVQKNGRAVALTWTASTDNRGVARYELFRNNTLVASPAGTSHNDSGLTENSSYQYAIRACDAANNCSAKSATIIVATGNFAPDTTAPTVPGNFTGKGNSINTVLLSWNASTDAAGLVALYNVFKDNVKIGSPTTTSFTASGMKAGERHSYAVQACDDSGNCSAKTTAISVATNPPDFSNLDFTTNSHEGYVHFGGNEVGPAPRANRPDALATPINGATANPRGFAFDITGNQLTWRWGANNVPQGTAGDVGFTRTAGDSGLEMHCSEDGNKTFKMAKLVNSTLTIPCSSANYTYFFRYKHPLAMSSLAGTDWIHTALFTIATRVNVNAYTPFTDGSSNWMRWRHPIAHDGCTAAVSDACHNNSLLRDLDRYTIWVDDSPNNVQVRHSASGGILRIEAARHHAGNSNGQQQFTYNMGTGFGSEFSYGQVIQFEITAVAGSQVYNDFSYYTVGLGWGNYGDPRLNPAGRASTTMIIAGAPGADIFNEQEAIFTQPLVTVHSEGLMNDFIVGHHLFHGIDPKVRHGAHDQVKIGERSCGGCHFRDGRGSEVIDTPRGKRLPPPVYGVKLLEWMVGREAGFRWDGQVGSVEDQIHNALLEDHGVRAEDLPPRVLETLVNYTEVLTVPARRPAVYDNPSVARGDVAFNEIGCAGCHKPEARTRADAPSHLRNISIRPYTDMKTWDLGGDQAYRTPALWGLSHNLTLLESRGRAVLFMHDGSAASVEAAIAAHGGAGQTSRSAYNALSAADKKAVVDFIKSL
ncbi:family 31 carbohydrate-binding protein, partial [Cellvibrio sp. OA-2007]|uniref:family 31 carbohydrate-binding protein n=1 Tax=Cellvibrio sp. OA-2007 TaxID=529823 RepID=UPI000A5A255D